MGTAIADGVGVPPLSNQSEAAGGGGSCSSPVNPGFYVLLFVPTTLCFSLMLNATRSQLPPMTVLGCVAFFSSWLLSLSPKLASLATFISAILVGCAGNLYSNATGRPAMAATASGIFILVPGCMALRSVFTLLSNASSGLGLTGLTSAILNVAVSIGAGVFISSLLVVPKEARVLTHLFSVHFFLALG